MIDARITYIFPSRSRPQRLFDALANINDLSESENYEIICAFDEDDLSMNNDEVREQLKQYNNVKYFYGLSANKVAACNRETNKISPETSIVCLHSDDFEYLEYGFDGVIREVFNTNFPEFDGVVHFHDGHQDRTMTYTIMGINLFRKLGYLYHRDFFSVYADNQLTEMAQIMNKYVYSDKRILRHNHPIFHLSAWDDLYRKNEAPEHYHQDRETFLKQKANNFGI